MLNFIEKYYLSDKMKQYISKNGTNGYHNNDCKINKIIARPITTDPNKRAGTTNYISHDVGDEFNLNTENVKNLRIRKLTPKECWRLMGFKDESFEKAQKVNSNTQLYKQAGNSIVVNVLEKIINNLHLELEHIKLLELFGGIGACSEAMNNLGLDYEIADYVEIDKYACASYNAIHETNFLPQDIQEWDKDISVDFIMHGSPCQDFSLAGKQAGGDEGSGTRSSLMYETLRIVEKLRPKYVLWENVKNVLGKQHKHNFDNYLNRMSELGYTNYYQVLNAKDYGVPQNRERVFAISILGNEVFKFPEKEELKIKLKDILEDSVNEKYYLDDAQVEKIHNSTFNQAKTRIQETNECQTLCARDWKDPKCVRVGGIFDDKKIDTSSGSIYDNEGLTPTLDTMQSGWRQPYIEEQGRPLNKPTRETLEKNKDKLEDGAYVDGYNRNIRTDKLSGTITTRTDASNNTYVVVKKSSKITNEEYNKNPNNKWSDLD